MDLFRLLNPLLTMVVTLVSETEIEAKTIYLSTRESHFVKWILLQLFDLVWHIILDHIYHDHTLYLSAWLYSGWW